MRRWVLITFWWCRIKRLISDFITAACKALPDFVPSLTGGDGNSVQFCMSLLHPIDLNPDIMQFLLDFGRLRNLSLLLTKALIQPSCRWNSSSWALASPYLLPECPTWQIWTSCRTISIRNCSQDYLPISKLTRVSRMSMWRQLVYVFVNLAIKIEESWYWTCIDHSSRG